MKKRARAGRAEIERVDRRRKPLKKSPRPPEARAPCHFLSQSIFQSPQQATATTSDLDPQLAPSTFDRLTDNHGIAGVVVLNGLVIWLPIGPNPRQS